MKKNFRIVLALVLALSMVLGTVPAMADPVTTGSITINSPIMGAQYWAYKVFDLIMDDNTNPTSFSYTIKAKLPGATQDADPVDNPFFAAVMSYANMPAAGEDLDADGLTLVPSIDDSNIYNIHVTEAFDAQAFGQYLKERMDTNYQPADGAPNDKIDTTKLTAYEPIYEQKVDEHGDPVLVDGQEQYYDHVTVATSKAIEFEKLPFGYYLIISEYPETKTTVTLSVDSNDPDARKWTITKDTTEQELDTIVEQYVTEVVTDQYVTDYINSHPELFKDSDGNTITYDDNTTIDNGTEVWRQARLDLIASRTADAKEKIAIALNQIAGSEADDNTQPLTSRLVFLDSTTPHADVVEKNETNKWDVPVNPEDFAQHEDLPDHGEPEGGKNIVIKEGVFDPETKTWNPQPVYADWSEANIGDDVHYQLAINTVNFERVEQTHEDNGTVVLDSWTVKPVKEYIIADYQNKNMTFNADKKLTVTIVKKQADGTVVQISDPVDYTAWATAGHFFVNDNGHDIEANKEVFDYGHGIVIPWVEEIKRTDFTTDAAFEAAIQNAKNLTKVVEFAHAEGATGLTKAQYDALQSGKDAYFYDEDDDRYYEKIAVYVEANENTPDGYKDTTTVPGKTLQLVDVIDADGNITKELLHKKDAQGNLMYELEETRYFVSKYDNDVTILVDYYMTLQDTALIEDENMNISQYGVTYLDDEDINWNPDTPNTPPENPAEPDSRKEQDDATVYTYALAIHKVDDEGKNLAGAKFKIKGLTISTTKPNKPGWYKLGKLNTIAYDGQTNTALTGEALDAALWDMATELSTDAKGFLVVEGLMTSQEVEIMETVAPNGYNKLETTLKANPQKTGDAVITKSVVYYYSDAAQTQPTGKVETTWEEEHVAVPAVNDVPAYDLIKVIKETTTTYTYANNEYTVTDQTITQNNPTEALIDQTQLKPVEIKVVNKTGVELPSTGGIGTTIFYVGGSLMVLAAAILLITKRRMGAED